MKTRSLTRTLTLGVLAAELLCAATFSIVSLSYEISGRRHAFDITLNGRADSLLGSVQDAEDAHDNVIVDPAELRLPSQDVYEVIMDTGRVVGRSPGISTGMSDALSAHPDNGYFDFQVDGRHYRGLRKPGIRIIDRDETHPGIRRPVTLLYASPTSRLWHQALEAIRFYLIAGLLLLLISGLAIAWFLRRSLSPLRELADRAARVSTSAWEFTPPHEALTTRELEPIATSIQALLSGLQQSFERQRQFTGDAAHELKTSIAILKSRLQLLPLRERTSDEYKRVVEELILDTQRMEELTQRMLVLARAEQSTHDRESGNLSAVLLAVMERLEPSLKLHQVYLSIQTLEGIIVTMPADDIDVLCSNLLMNAIQHSREETLISATMQTKDGLVVLTIADEGEGIAPEALPHVFDRFYRADAARSRATGGAGLGLAICKAIVERAGGTIAISSTLGQGTQVAVTLPLVPDWEIAADQLTADQLAADQAASTSTSS